MIHRPTRPRLHALPLAALPQAPQPEDVRRLQQAGPQLQGLEPEGRGGATLL